ncbi:MAG: hypothetical protein FWG68_10860 [Defluviitaleaceae bacterium]|nr:hypothetical protein [Defluviitaleaceae bacterium]
MGKRAGGIVVGATVLGRPSPHKSFKLMYSNIIRPFSRSDFSLNIRK